MEPTYQMPPQQPTASTPLPSTDKEGLNVVAIVVLAVIVIIIAALAYMFTMSDAFPVETLPTTDELRTSSADSDVSVLMTQSSSDEISSIEADLSATDLNSLDDALADVEASF